MSLYVEPKFTGKMQTAQQSFRVEIEHYIGQGLA